MKTKNTFVLIIAAVLLSLTSASARPSSPVSITKHYTLTVTKTELVSETALTIAATEYTGATIDANFRGLWLRKITTEAPTCRSPLLGEFYVSSSQLQGVIPSWGDTFYLTKTTLSDGGIRYTVTKIGRAS